MTMRDACLDELAKLGEVSPEEARRALDRLQDLERGQPTTEQALRYGTVGALAGPAIGAVGDVLAGKKPFGAGFRVGATGVLEAVGKKQIARNIAADALRGGLTGGAIPIARHALDQAAEKGKLQRFMQQYEASQKTAPEPEVPVIHKVGGVGQGAAMTVSEYSGPTGGGGFNLVSGLPNKAPPGLQSVVQKAAEFAKLGFMNVLMSALQGEQDQGFKGAELLAPKAATPGAMLRQAQNVGTSAHNQAPGPSIDQTVGRVQPPAFKAPGMPKLPGWGKPTMGATKATEGVRRAFTK